MNAYLTKNQTVTHGMMFRCLIDWTFLCSYGKPHINLNHLSALSGFVLVYYMFIVKLLLQLHHVHHTEPEHHSDQMCGSRSLEYYIQGDHTHGNWQQRTNKENTCTHTHTHGTLIYIMYMCHMHEIMYITS